MNDDSEYQRWLKDYSGGEHPMLALGGFWLGAIALTFAIWCGYDSWHNSMVEGHYRDIEYVYAQDHGWDFKHLTPDQYQDARDFAQRTLNELGMDQE
jgi:hypothetical protein